MDLGDLQLPVRELAMRCLHTLGEAPGIIPEEGRVFDPEEGEGFYRPYAVGSTPLGRGEKTRGAYVSFEHGKGAVEGLEVVCGQVARVGLRVKQVGRRRGEEAFGVGALPSVEKSASYSSRRQHLRAM